jgi:hypothetical protein
MGNARVQLFYLIQKEIYSLVLEYVLPLRRVIRFPDEPTRRLLVLGAGGAPDLARSTGVDRCWIVRT